MKPIRLFELFAGYGGASFALKKAGIPFDIVGYSEIDKYAIQCYEQNHCKADVHSGCWGFHNYGLKPKNYGDITKINPEELPYFDLLTGGFPCQSFSIAGKRKGFEDERGPLFFDIIRIAKVKQPKLMLLENVKGLVNHNKGETLKVILRELRSIGYDVIYKVLNSKDYGIPQNRERIWFVCKLGQWEFNEFQFPLKEELKIFLKDILEDKVDEKYYLKDSQVKKLMKGFNRFGSTPENDKAIMIGNLTRYTMKSPRNPNFKDAGVTWCLDTKGNNGIVQLNNPKHSSQRVYNTEGIACTISAGNNGGGKSPCKIIQMNKPKHSNDRIYNTKGISPTLNTMQGGNRQPFIVASRGRYSKDNKTEQNLEPKLNGTTNTITSVQKDNYIINEFRIRKLTPKECFRLQGFLKDEINLDNLSDTQIYKLAGNGWDVSLVSKIFKQVFKDEEK